MVILLGKLFDRFSNLKGFERSQNALITILGHTF